MSSTQTLVNIGVLAGKLEAQAEITSVLLKQLQSTLIEYQEFLEMELENINES